MMETGKKITHSYSCGKKQKLIVLIFTQIMPGIKIKSKIREN